MKGLILTVLSAVFVLTIPAHAQFGGGIVLDPTQSAHAAQQIIQSSQLYTTTIQTTQNVMATYNQLLHGVHQHGAADMDASSSSRKHLW
jgi:hypothetical protein